MGLSLGTKGNLSPASNGEEALGWAGGGGVLEVVAVDFVFVSAILFSSSSPIPALRFLTVFVLARY